MNTQHPFAQFLDGLASARIPTRAEFDSAPFETRLKIRDQWRAAWNDPTHPENDSAKWRCIYASMNGDIVEYDRARTGLSHQGEFQEYPDEARDREVDHRGFNK